MTQSPLPSSAIVSDDRAASYRVLAESIPQQVWTARPDGALDYVNGVILAYFKQSSEAILGAGWLAVLHPEDVDACVARWTASLTTGGDYEIEFRLRRHDGTYRWHLGRATPERDSTGKIVRWFGTNTDVHERRLSATAAHHHISELLESIAEPMIVLDEQWCVSYVNADGAGLVGMGPGELMGKNLWELFPAARESSFYAEYHRARTENVAVSFEAYFTRRDEWFDVRAYPMRDGRLYVSFRSATARRDAAAKLVRELQHASLRADVGAAFADTSSLAETLDLCAGAFVARLDVAFARIWTLNEQTATLELVASAGMYTHLDGPHARVPVGKFKIGLIAAEVAPHLTNDVAHDPRIGDPAWAARTGMVAFAGYPLVAHRKCIGVVAMFAQAALPPDTINAIAAVADVIAQGLERKRAEQALELRAGELARSNAELERFAYVASHDLQEPLRMVASYTQLLGRRYRGKLDADADEFIAFAVDGANRMQALINDLLAFSRVGSRATEPVKTSLEKPFATAVANLAAAIAESGAVITHDPLPELPIDQHQLVQLFQNLIGNAIKFRSAQPPAIHVGAQQRAGAGIGAGWAFSVRDNGIGISGEFFDRLFVLFQRLHTRTEYPGNGIGLAICKKIVERHGGRIWVESAPGAGTTFHFTLGGAA